MQKLKDAARSFLVEDDGATMVEYGLMIALIAAVCMVAVATIGTKLNTKFTAVSTEIAP